MTKKNKKDKYKLTKEICVLSKNDQRLLELVRVAKEIVLREDILLLKELAKN